MGKEKCGKCGKEAVAYLPGNGIYICQECWDQYYTQCVGDYLD